MTNVLSRTGFLLAASIGAASLVFAASTCAESTDTGAGGTAGGVDGGSDAQDEDPVITFDAGSEAGDASIGDGCVSSTVEGELVPLDLFILLDRSGSMTTDDKWGTAVTAIKGFADSPGVAGLGIGLTYFPPVAGNECTPATYTSLAVPLATVPGNAGAIKASLQATSPSGGTPMRPALEGAISFMSAHLQKNAMHEGVVILVTDGIPGGCTNNTAAAVTATAAAGLAGSPSVRTFAVGMTGADFGNLDDIAVAGGTTKSFNVGSGPSATAALVAALQQIQKSALACEYILPLPNPGQGTLDLSSVEVVFTPGINEPPVSIGKVANAGACGQISGGFYYDDPNTPTRVVLCPASCTLVKGGTADAKVRIVLGCIQVPT